jgi:hypothetical protein
MPQNEQGKAASSKPNKGQDENLHSVTTPTGETIQVTQRDWKENYRGVEGYHRTDGDDDADDGTEAEAVAPPQPVNQPQGEPTA